MKRRVFTFASMLSLVLCLLMCGAWVRSYFAGDLFHWARIGQRNSRDEYEGRIGIVDLATGRGKALLMIELNSVYSSEWRSLHETGDADDITVPLGLTNDLSGTFGPQVFEVYFNHLGAAFYRDDVNGIYRNYYLIVPFWLPATLAGLLPGLWITARIRQRGRGNSGRCASCGYDLRATPEKCPECGKIP